MRAPGVAGIGPGPAVARLAGVRRTGLARWSAALAAGGGLWPAVVLWFWWVLDDAGYPPEIWLAGLPFLAGACALLAAAVPIAPPRGPRAWALACFAGLAALTWLSLLWAPDPGAALAEAQRRSLYLAAFAMPLLWPPSIGALRAGAVTFCGLALAGAVVAFASAGGGSDLVDGRFAEPGLYPNAVAGLLAMGGLAALVLAARPDASPAWRAAAWAGSGALLAASLLAQSRGSLAAIVVVAATLLAVAPFRRSLVAPLLACAIAVAAIAPVLFDVREAALSGSAGAELRLAAIAIAAVAGALALSALAYGRLAGSLTPRPARPGRRLRATRPVVAAGAVALAVLAVLSAPWLADRAADFSSADYERVNSADSRFSAGLGSNRSDYWRVSVETFADQPLRGLGAGSFRTQYLAERDTRSAPRYAHGLGFATLAELGAAGIALLAGLAVALGAAAVSVLRTASAPARIVRVAALVPLGYLAVHAAADWVGAFPLLAVPALGLAGAALAERGPSGTRQVSRRRALLIVAPVLVLAVVALPQLAAERFSAWAVHARASEPAAALEAFRDAGRLNPLAAGAPLGEAVVCLDLGRVRCAQSAFSEAAARAPRDWFAQLELGLLGLERGRRQDAAAHLRRAAALNPREPLTGAGLRALHADGSLTAARAAQAALGRQGWEPIDASR